MSKADVIEVEGTVLEKLPNAMFKVELEQTRSISSYQWKAAYELYPHSPGRQSNDRAVPIRSGQGTYYLER